MHFLKKVIKGINNNKTLFIFNILYIAEDIFNKI